jgi:hypothetical protein
MGQESFAAGFRADDGALLDYLCQANEQARIEMQRALFEAKKVK